MEGETKLRPLHYGFVGEATIIWKAKSWSRYLDAQALPQFDVSLVDGDPLRAVETLREAPGSAVISRPSLRIADDRLNTKYLVHGEKKRTDAFIAFRCWTNPKGCGEGSNT